MKFPALKNRLLCLAAAISLLGVPIARAGVLDDIGGAISSLRGQKSRVISAAQAARSKARAQSEQVEFLHQRLQKTSRLLDQASENYAHSYRQMQRTERKIAELETQSAQVARRFDEHKTQFGLRLASMQRHGQTNFLQVALGSASLADLSRRTAYFQALTRRDAALQEGLKSDKAEIKTAQNALMAQWKLRRDAQKQAQRERNRIAEGEAEQLQSWKQMSKARLALLSYAVQQERNLGSIDGKIGSLRGRASSIVAENQARESRARQVRYEMQERQERIAARERALDEYREQMSRERSQMRAQTRFRSRVRRRIVRDYSRSQAPRVAATPSRSRYSRSNPRSRYSSRSRYRSTHYSNTRYTRRGSGSIRYARQSSSIPPQFAPRVGLMPRYAPRVELAPMPIEALQNPAKFSPPAQ